MIKYEFGNNPGKIKKYLAFWNRDDVKKPLIGFSYKSWFPLMDFKANLAWQGKYRYLTPEMIKIEDFIEDQIHLLREGETIEDDIIRGAAPCQEAVPWLCGMLGLKLRILLSNIVPEEENFSWDKLENLKLDHENPWFIKYINFAKLLVKISDGRFPISHGAEFGPSDLVSQLRGQSQSVIDYIDYPENTIKLLWKTAKILKELTEFLWSTLPLFYGGYFDTQYSLWAPNPIIRMQEDAVAYLSPKIYKKFIQPVDRYLAQHFNSAFMHLHSTSMFVLDEILEIDELKCFEINLDDNLGAPPVNKMIMYFKKFQQAKKSIIIRGAMAKEDLKLILNSLSPKGLYLYIMIKDLKEYETLKHVIN